MRQSHGEHRKLGTCPLWVFAPDGIEEPLNAFVETIVIRGSLVNSISVDLHDDEVERLSWKQDV